MTKKEEFEQWLPAIGIGLLGGATLFFVNILLAKFVFKNPVDVQQILLTAFVFAVVFTIVSYQWDKKKVQKPKN